MNTSLKIACLGSLLVARVAAADEPTAGTTVGLDPSDAVNAQAVVEGPGYKLGESTEVHPQVGIETGFVNNVFYESETPVTSALIRLIAELGIGSLSVQRLSALEGDSNTEARTNIGQFQYRADAYLNYDIYLSGNDNVTEQDGLGAGLTLRGLVRPQQPVSFGFQNQYQRLIRAANFESLVDTNRDVNNLRLGLQFRPTASKLSGQIGYQNTIDVFERQSQRFANRMINTGSLRVNWRLFPKTIVYGEYNQSVITGLGSSSEKVTSYPLMVVAGIQTLLSAKTGISGRIGYANGLYSEGPNYSAVEGGLMFGYRYSPLGGIGLGYSYHHEDSINANFYRDHAINLGVSQQFVPFLIAASLDVRFRHYEGITLVMSPDPTRDDLIVAVNAGMRYNFRNWLATTLDYQFASIQTDYRYMTADGVVGDPSYLRHQLLVGMRAAF